jgi:hypothetical protein
MTTVRTHRYRLAADDAAEFIAQCVELIDRWRGAGFDRVETRLYRLEGETHLDIWRLGSEAEMSRASDAMDDIPLVGPTLAMTSGHSSVDGAIVDER